MINLLPRLCLLAHVLASVAFRSASAARIRANPQVFARTPAAHLRSEKDFLLTAEEVATSRNGVERTGLQLSSTDNTVEYLANGDVIMKDLKDSIEKTKKGDFIYTSFWEFDIDMMLDPQADESPEAQQIGEASRLINLLGNASKRGVDVRTVVSWGATQMVLAPIAQMCDRIKERCGPWSCVLDARHGSSQRGSLHQKLWLFRTDAELTAYIGSMDVALKRWDTAAHLAAGDARYDKQFEGAADTGKGSASLSSMLRQAWHDTMYKVQGGAAEDALQLFVQQYNDPVPTHPKGEAIPQGNQLELWLPSQQQGFAGYNGTLQMQVVRTLSCRGSQGIGTGGLGALFQGFAPHGEYSYAAAFFKALRRARRFVFIADQFMWFDEAMAAVVETALRDTVEHVFIMTNAGLKLNLGLGASIDLEQTVMQSYQYRAVYGQLAKLDPSGKAAKKVRMFSAASKHPDWTGNAVVYDHEKTLLVDDEFALVGSAGVERAAFTNDNEVAIAVHSKEFVTDLRRRMFAEWLEVPTTHEALSTLETSVAEWLRKADLGTERLRNHMPENALTKAQEGRARQMYNFLEPDGRCSGRQHAQMWQNVLATGSGGAGGRRQVEGDLAGASSMLMTGTSKQGDAGRIRRRRNMRRRRNSKKPTRRRRRVRSVLAEAESDAAAAVSNGSRRRRRGGGRRRRRGSGSSRRRRRF